MVISTTMLENGTSTNDVQYADTERTLMNLRSAKSRQILNKELFYCDATDCEHCSVRFQCFTSRGIIQTDKDVEKWRLRDGSSKFREYRSERMRKM